MSSDPTLLLDVRFEGDATSETGDEPVVADSLVFDTGHSGQALDMRAPAQLAYDAFALDRAEGTVELWISPFWPEEDALDHFLVSSGNDHGFLLLRDQNWNLRLVVNRYGNIDSPPLETGVTTNIAEWTAGNWHHVAATWTDTAISLYVDGVRVDRQEVTELHVEQATVHIGSEGIYSHAEALIDDLRIYAVARTSTQILESYEVSRLSAVLGGDSVE